MAAPFVAELGKAIPFLASSLFGGLFGGGERRANKDLMQAQTDMIRQRLMQLRDQQPGREGLHAGLLGRLPTHMKQFFPQFNSTQTPPIFGPQSQLLRGPSLQNTAFSTPSPGERRSAAHAGRQLPERNFPRF